MRIIKHVAATAVALFLVAAPAGAATTKIPGMQSTIQYSKTSTAASGFGNYTRATSQVIYDSATDTYTLRDTGSLTTTSSFGPANISGSNANFTTYTKTSGSTTETLRLLKAGAPLISLTYVDYGRWRRATTASGTTSVNDTYVVFGTKSPASAVTSGTASYATVVDGTFVNKTGSYAVSGTGTFGADFTAGTITYSTTASATPETSGTAFSFGTMSGTGSIASASASFKGTGAANGSGYAMDVAGNFYGPGADEIGGLFHIKGNGGNGTGVILGN
ncbi:MAG TPA: transferrin-binding protein-like solute binding protein [Sphingomicrobium sp.]|nr:transferrin-binding protein-like solute binding protein [Sphingomicrobium sp.]